MTNLINDFLSQPLWLSIPLVMVYVALLAYFLYILWHYRRNTLATVLTIAALAVGQSVNAKWTVEVTDYNSSTHETTFTITRSGDTSEAQTVRYRTVGLSAFAGQHFIAKSGALVFPADETGNTSMTVTVTETTPDTDAYKYYQDGTTDRQYMLEVSNLSGSHLADCTRTMTNGTSFSAAKVSQSITNLVYFNSSGNYTSGVSSSKYMDVSYTPPTSDVEKSGTLSGYVLIDDSYDYANKAATVSTSTLINSTGATAAYLNEIDYKIAATVCFTEKERDDGYQYVQIIAGDGNASYDTGYDPDGAVNDPVNSIYKACFELSTASNAEGKAFFPHRYSTATGTNEFSLSDGKLWQQAFKSSSYQTSTFGSLIFDANVANITTRFDAGGKNDDTWGYKDLFVRMALIDQIAPTVLAVSADPGYHPRDKTVYVSVAFSEIVAVTGTPTLSTTSDNNWGSLSYVTGSGTNVLTFKGTIPQDATGNLNITGINTDTSNYVTDLAGNAFSGDVTAEGLCMLDASYGGEFNHMTYNIEDNCYEIADADGLCELASRVNHGNECYGLVFKMTNDIAFSYTTAWDDDTSTEHNFDGIGGHEVMIGNTLVPSKNFYGTFDGGGHTISGLRICISDYYFTGLFGCIGSSVEQYSATVKDVTIADARLTGWQDIGGIVGFVKPNCTVSGCTVAGNVTIRGITCFGSAPINIGGIAGSNQGTVTGCTSSVRIIYDGNADASSFGGIVGGNQDCIENCTAAGVVVPSVNRAGAIVGMNSFGATALSGNTYHSSLVGTYTFNIGTGKYYTSSTKYSNGDQTGATLNTSRLWLFDYRDNSPVIVGYAATYNSNSSTAYNAQHPSVSSLTVTLKGRTLYKDGDWNTLCLPFDVSSLTANGPLKGATAMELDTEGTYDTDKKTGFDPATGTLTLNFKSVTKIYNKKPYIIKWESGENIFEPSFSSIDGRHIKTLTASNTGITSQDGYVTFCGTDRPVALTAGDKSNLYLGSNNKLYWPTATKTIGAFRAYFDLADGATAREFVLNFGEDENTTGIISTTNFTNYTNSADAWYDMQGRKLDGKPTAKGLYIVNGKKVVIK
jgi:hypothetical protein